MFDVVTGTFCINSKSVKVLFDSGASYSFISKSRIKDLGLENPEKTSFSVAIPSGETFHCSILFRGVSVNIGKTKSRVICFFGNGRSRCNPWDGLVG